MRYLFFIMFFPVALTAFEPWGKDSELAFSSPPPKTQRANTPVLGPLAELLIRFHQGVISPIDGPRSHFKPSSSQYMLDAIRKYGFFLGFVMGFDRLMRENSDLWVYSTVPDGMGGVLKFDPVR